MDFEFYSFFESFNSIFGDVELKNGILIIFISFFTSAMTAAFGIGGGVTLLAFMSFLVPIHLVVPIHGVAQISSNFGRVIITSKWANFKIFFAFLPAVLIGAFLGSFLSYLPAYLLRFSIAIFILYMLWGTKIFPPIFNYKVNHYIPVFFTGIFTSFISMLVGATGPIVLTVLSRIIDERKTLVATGAICMTAQHVMKSLAFMNVGFNFLPYLYLILGIIIFGFLGTLLGTHILVKSSNEQFKKSFKFSMSIIAMIMIVQSLSIFWK